jgi:transposase
MVAAGLKDLAHWLRSLGCTCAAMEGTGVYWMPVYEALEGNVSELIVANAHHIKNVPGRKTDVKDSEWICDLARHGLLKPSFVPSKSIRELRDVTRSRHKLVQASATERNRLLKLLEQCGIKLATYLSDVFGVSGREMLTALIHGKESPAKIATFGRGRLKSKESDLKLALEAPLSETSRFLLGQQYGRIVSTEAHIGRLDKKIASLLKPYRAEDQLLQTIVGIGAVTSSAIIGEVGVDLSGFRNQGAFSAWCGVAPGNNMSAGRRKRAPINQGNPFMRELLTECAWAAIKSPGYLQTKYYKLKARRGAKRAIIAIAHKLAIAVYQVLTKREAYRELSPEQVERSSRNQMAKLARRLTAHGYLVLKPAVPPPAQDLTPELNAAPPPAPKRSRRNKSKALRG